MSGRRSPWWRAAVFSRPDPQQPKRRGLTFFVLDTTSRRIEVRPPQQLTGEAEFNEVYLDDVPVTDDVLGEVNGGWTVALTTLTNERVWLGGRPADRGSGQSEQLVECYRQARAAGRAGDAEPPEPRVDRSTPGPTCRVREAGPYGPVAGIAPLVAAAGLCEDRGGEGIRTPRPASGGSVAAAARPWRDPP